MTDAPGSVPQQSIYQGALGQDFARLHPKMQWRCGLAPGDEVCQVGRGTMEEIRRAWWARPVLAAVAGFRILCPEGGQHVPFTITGHAYLDRFGRSTVAATRRFQFRGRYRLSDSTTVFSAPKGCLVDYLGTRQNLASELFATVDADGGLCLIGGVARLHLGRAAVKLPSALAGNARVREWWDEPRQRFGIDVQVRSRLGEVLAYRGFFDVAEHPCPQADLPTDASSR